MPIYHGKSKDGSDMKEFKGFYVYTCGNFWGSAPFDKNGDVVIFKKSKSRYHK